ncbi:restriction endonuclease subunit S [Vibrio astriarenae]
MQYNKVALGDLLLVLTDYHANGAYKKLKENVELLDEEDFALMVRTTNFENNDFSSSLKFISEHAYNFLEKSKVYGGDLIMNKIANAGSIYLMPDLKCPVSLAMNLFLIRVDETKANPVYVYIYLKVHEAYVKQFANGSVTKTITKEAVRNLEISLPPRNIQDQIAEHYGSLSKKIEVNSRINQTLEEMAQAIFKSWFVDFDPVKAKMNGEQPEGMDAATASLFPEKLDSETGIPEGWSRGVISDIAKLNGKSWTKKKHPDEVHYVDLANTKNGVIESITSYEFEDAPSRARRVLNPGDTIVGTVRPGNRSFAYIGETEQPLTGSTGFAVLTPKEEFWSSLVYLATTNDDSIDEYARLADGGAYPAIKPVVVAETECAIPTEEIAKKFWEITGPMLKKANQNRLENEELAALRDTLLPKLLSGDIELPASEAD